MNITDTIDADQIEIGDQIRYLGDLIEVDDLGEELATGAIIVYGFSHVTGDRVNVPLSYNARVDLWSI